MIKGTEKTNELIFDIDRIKMLLDYIDHECINSKYGESQEIIKTIIQETESILKQVKRIPTIQEINISESEEEAQRYFGEEFLNRFEELRKKLEEQNVSLYIHGTSEESSKNILEEGLKYKLPTLNATAVKQSGLEEQEYYQGYSQLLNWPHHNWKNLIMIGVPKECEGNRKEALPLWKYDEHEEEKAVPTNDYRIPSEFIIGEIDVNNKEIVVNPLYTNQHNYTGLIHDVDLTNDKKNTMRYEDSESVEKVEEIENNEIDGVDSDIEAIFEHFNTILNHIDIGNKILENLNESLPDFSHSIVLNDGDIKKRIEHLKKLIPSLKTIKQFQEEQAEEIFNRESRNVEDDEFEEDWSGKEFEDLDWDEKFEMDLEEIIEDTRLSDVNTTTNMLKTNNREQTKEK